MAVTENSYTGNGSTTNYSFTFPYLKSTDVQVQVDAAVTTAWQFANATTVQFNTAPANGAKIKILRDTNVDSLAATFYAGSSIKSEDLNDNYTQNLYKTQEVGNRFFSNTGGTMTGDLTLAEDVELIFEGATDDAHETKLTVADPTADRTITLPDTTGTVVTTGDTGTVATGMIAADAVNGTKIADDSINSEHYVDGSIDTQHIADSQITTAKIADNQVTTAKIVDANVTTAKIADNAVTMAKLNSGALPTDITVASANLVDGTIATADIADNAVTMAKLNSGALPTDITVASANLVNGTVATADIADDAVTNAKIAAGAVGTGELNTGAITTAKIADDAVTNAKLAAGAVGTGELDTGAITTAKLAADSVTNAKISAGAVGTTELDTGAITTAKIASDAVTNAKIADDSIDSEHYVDGSIDTAHLGNTQVTDAKLASNSVTTSKITDANVTTAKIANDAITIGKIGCEQTTISDSDSHIPTSGAVVDYVAAQIAPLGGLEVVATEVAFPNTQPASGVVISISDAGGVVVNGSGVSTTGRTVGGSTVTINGFPSSLQSETLAAGVGLMVSSTGSSQTYNYHKILGKESDIKQLSDDINDFAERYRVSSSAPTSSLHNGDLWFDTANGKMMVYNSTNTAWEEVSAIGSFNINTLSSSGNTGGGSATFNGSAYRFTLSNPPQDAQQLLVSINGVIQKPNTGSSQPSEGFAVSGNDIIFSAAPASGSTSFIITLGQAVQIGTPSDGSVTTAKLTSGAVTTAKIADSAVTAAKIAKPIDLADNEKIRLGTGNDLSLFHDGNRSAINNSTGELRVLSGGDVIIGMRAGDNTSYAEQLAAFKQDGAVELYYNNSKKFETQSYGCSATGQIYVTHSGTTPGFSLSDNGRSGWGSGNDLVIYHNGTASYVDNSTGPLYLRGGTNSIQINPKNDEWAIVASPNAGVEVAYDGVKKFETTSAGAHCHGNLDFFDGHKIRLGTHTDLQIYHSGSHSYIQDAGTGTLRLEASEVGIISANGSETMAQFVENNAVSLRYDNSTKLQTTSTGVRVNSYGSSHGLYVHHSNGNEVARLAHNGSGDEGVLVLKDGGSTTISLNGESNQNSTLNTGGKFIFNGTSSNAPAGSVHIRNAFLRLQAANQNSSDFSQQVGIEWSQETGSDVQVGKIVMRRDAWGGAPHNMDFWTRTYSNNVQRAFILHHNGNATLTGTLTQSGSDIRLKENITQIPNALTKVNSLTGFTFNWNKTAQDLGYQGLDHDDLQVGLSAQDVEKIQPEVIKPMGQDPEYKTIQYEKLVPLLVESIKELTKKVEALEAK